jgi:hypothetical protein
VVNIGEIDPSSPHSGIQYGDTSYSNPPSLFGTSPGSILASVNQRGKIKLGRQRRETNNAYSNTGVLGEWGEVFSSRRNSCCST